jgi:hypothetical protein
MGLLLAAEASANLSQLFQLSTSLPGVEAGDRDPGGSHSPACGGDAINAPECVPVMVQCAGVAPPEDVDLALAKLAARNNAEWCDIFCRSHGVTGTFHSDAWASAIRTPALYPDAVALDHSLSVERVLSYVDSSTGCSIKDSFAAMDLSPTGFRVLFEAEWMLRAPQPTPRGPQNGLRWEFVRDSNTLRRWEAEWARDSAPTGFFLPRCSGTLTSSSWLDTLTIS